MWRETYLCIIQGIRASKEGESVAKQHGKTFVITIKFSQITCNCLLLGGVG